MKKETTRLTTSNLPDCIMSIKEPCTIMTASACFPQKQKEITAIATMTCLKALILNTFSC